MIDCLVVFGDSTTQGSELLPGDKCYGELLKEKFNFKKVVNLGTPASGPQHLIVQLKIFLDQTPVDQLSQYLAVFWVGGYDRFMTYHNHEWIFLTPNGGFASKGNNYKFADVANEQYFKYFHSAESAEFNLNTSLITLQTICKKYSICDYYLPGWQSLKLWPEVDKNKVYDCGNSSFYNLFGLEDKIQYSEKNRSNVYIKPNLTHPNQSGHQLIADTAYEFISNSIDNLI